MTTPIVPTSTQPTSTHSHLGASGSTDDQQSYAPQVTPAPVGAPQPTTLAFTNTYALLAIFFAFISPVAGIIFGHLALSQIKRNGDAGRGIGLTGLILSYASLAALSLIVFLYVGLIIIMFGAMGAAFSDVDFDM